MHRAKRRWPRLTPPRCVLECDGGPIEVDANPQRTEQESVFQCEVTNDSALAEEIDLDFEVSGSTFTVAISEDSFSLQGGESETFDVTVRVPINEPAGTTADFDITAMVSSIQGVPIEQANVSSSDSVRLEVAEFHRLDLSRASITTPNIEAGASYALEVRVQNLGNAQSNVRVELTSETLDRLREAGFELPEEEVVSVSLNPSEESETISFSVTAPVEVPEIIEESITVQASIFGLTPAVSEEITINLQVQRSTSSVVADIGGLDSLSEDTLLRSVPRVRACSSSCCSSWSSSAQGGGIDVVERLGLRSSAPRRRPRPHCLSARSTSMTCWRISPTWRISMRPSQNLMRWISHPWMTCRTHRAHRSLPWIAP